MQRMRACGLAFLLAVCLLSGCGPSPEEMEVLTTQVAVSVFAAQTAMPPTAVPAPVSTFDLAADGSGDYATLAEAVQAAPAGSIITLGPGTYRLERRLNVRQPLQLIGAGKDQTEIVSAAGGYVVLISGDGPFLFENLTFRHEGDAPASAVYARAGDVTFTGCRFTGAVSGDLDNQAGLFIYGETSGLVQDCIAEGNDLIGFYIVGSADVVLEGNQGLGNTGIGIAAGTSSTSVVRKNQLIDNGIGIATLARAESTLEENVCTQNEVGIMYVDSAKGVARLNECTENTDSGILVDERAQPTLEQNTCSGNAGGILYWGMAKGTAQRNACTGNEIGIGVGDQAQPTLDSNTCSDNSLSGIVFADYAGGVASQNECAGNGKFGILVEMSANPTIMGNNCYDNLAGDVEFVK